MGMAEPGPQTLGVGVGGGKGPGLGSHLGWAPSLGSCSPDRGTVRGSGTVPAMEALTSPPGSGPHQLGLPQQSCRLCLIPGLPVSPNWVQPLDPSTQRKAWPIRCLTGGSSSVCRVLGEPWRVGGAVGRVGGAAVVQPEPGDVIQLLPPRQPGLPPPPLPAA